MVESYIILSSNSRIGVDQYSWPPNDHEQLVLFVGKYRLFGAFPEWSYHVQDLLINSLNGKSDQALRSRRMPFSSVGHSTPPQLWSVHVVCITSASRSFRSSGREVSQRRRSTLRVVPGALGKPVDGFEIRILHHLETRRNQCRLVFTGESSETRVS